MDINQPKRFLDRYSNLMDFFVWQYRFFRLKAIKTPLTEKDTFYGLRSGSFMKASFLGTSIGENYFDLRWSRDMSAGSSGRFNGFYLE